MEIILATHNKNKILEFKQLVKEIPIKLITLYDLEDYEEILEDGVSFYENALIKARYIAQRYQIITIADDSGLLVDELNGAPGVYSARYSKDADVSNNDLLLKNMYNIDNRSASFHCSLVIYLPNNEHYAFEGKLKGTITKEIIGNNGFGYDPLFYVDEQGCTLAEMSDSLKNAISHRAIAFNKGMVKLNEIINNK